MSASEDDFEENAPELVQLAAKENGKCDPLQKITLLGAYVSDFLLAQENWV